MPAILFKDISKTANDTLKDDYDFNRKLKIKTKTANGVTFTTEGTMAGNKSILAKLSGSFKHSCGVNFKKLQVTTHGRIIGETEVDNIGLDGLKLTFKAEDGAVKNAAGVKYRPSGRIGAEYRLDNLSSTVEIDCASNSINGSGVFAYDNFLVGGQGAVSIEKSSLTDHNLALSYGGSDFHASLMSKKKFGVFSLAFDHKPCSHLIYAGIFNHDTKTTLNSLTVGGRYSPDKETTYCGKVDSAGLVSLAFVQKLRPQVSMTTSAHLDVKNVEGEAHKFGLSLTLG